VSLLLLPASHWPCGLHFHRTLIIWPSVTSRQFAESACYDPTTNPTRGESEGSKAGDGTGAGAELRGGMLPRRIVRARPTRAAM